MSEYFVLIREINHPGEPKAVSVGVKEGAFFRQQGGDREPWGRAWQRIEADSVGDARLKGYSMAGVEPPAWIVEASMGDA